MKISIKKILLTMLFLALCIEFLYLTVLPTVINHRLANGDVVEVLKKNTGLKLSYDNAKIIAYPDFSIGFITKNVQMKDTGNNSVISASEFNIVLRIFPLLFKDWSIKSLEVSDFKLLFSWKKDNKIYLGNYALNLELLKNQNMHPDIDFLAVSNANIRFDDLLINQKTDIKIQSADFMYVKHKNLKLSLISDIFINNKKQTSIEADITTMLPLDKALNQGSAKINVNAKNINLAAYSRYLSYLFKQDVKNATGVVNAVIKNNDKILQSDIAVDNLNIQMQNPLDSIQAKSALKFVSRLGFEHNDLILKEVNIFSNDWLVKLSGKVRDYTSKNAKLQLKAVLNNSDIHSMYWLVPTLKEDTTLVIRKFKKYGAWGKVTGSIDIKGSLKKPLLFGELNLSDVYIVKNNPVVEHCKIYTKFLGDKMYIKTRVFAGYGEYVDIEGTAVMAFYAPGDFHVVSSPNVDLGTAEYMLVPIHDIVGFDIGPVPYMKIQGKGNIELKTNGTVLDGFAYGQFNFRNTTATLQGLNTTLKNTEGVLDFNGKDMHFYTKKAFVNNQRLKIDGKANLNGDIDFDVTSDSIELSDLLKILRTSSLLADKKQMAELIDTAAGKVKTSIKIKGVVKDFGDVLKNDTLLDISGSLQLLDSTGKIRLIPVAAHKLKGKINFDNNDWNIDINGLVGTASLKINGGCKNNKTDLMLNAPSLKTDEIVKTLTSSGILPALPATNSNIKLFAHYKNDSPQFDFNGLQATGYFTSGNNKSQNTDFIIHSGSFNLDKGNLLIKKFKATVYNSDVYADGSVEDFFTKDYKINGKLNLTNFNIKAFDSIKKLNILPSYAKNLLNAYDNYQGRLDANISCVNNDLRGKINLNNLKFNHRYFKTPISVERGDILLEGTKITLHSIIANIDDTPVFLNVSFRDLDKTMKLGGYFTTKLTEQFVNKYINTMLTYPVKPKGDISITTDISGNVNNIRLKPKVKFAQGSDIYYMGASLGDEQYPREINSDVTIKNGDIFDIHSLVYKMYLTDDNNKTVLKDIFKVSGVIKKIHEGYAAEDLNIQTKHDANVNLFNLLFKKSVLKKGMFNCKLNVNGNLNSPLLTGSINMHNLDMPLYDTLLKSINVKFEGKSLYAKVQGITLGSDFSLDIIGANKLTRPYSVDMFELKSKYINLDKFIDSLTKIPTPDTTARLVDSGSDKANINVILPAFNVSDIQIKHGIMTADEVVINDLSANNYSSEFVLDENMMLNVDKLSFDVTTGKVLGTAEYDFVNGKIKVNVSGLNVDSNKVASSFFGFKDQIFGTSNGNIAITTHGSSIEERIKNMFGYVYFEVSDGKMPKLGSVEYLLKAGNILKSGITGASLNNFIQLIAPIKTGYFDSIKGSFTLKNGIAQNIEIYSKGSNLNLYINGEFDVLQTYANMRVFGRLTKRANNILGPIGNLSFNSLLNAIPGIKLNKNEKRGFISELNKIPGVELDDEQYRVFTAKIDGKINENKFVKNFRWME